MYYCHLRARILNTQYVDLADAASTENDCGKRS
jgi:hypothetical protein